MDFDFCGDWKKAKVQFELVIKDKKPGKKFLGAFRLGSGIEKACKDLDAAIGSPSPNSLAKAEKAYVKATEEYVRTLRKAAKDENATDLYKEGLAFLEKTLEDIRQDFLTAKHTETADVMDKGKGPVKDDVQITFDYTIPTKVIAGLTKSTFPKEPVIVNFATKSTFAVSGADGRTKLPALAAAQKDAATALKAFLAAIKAVQAQLKVRMAPKDAWDKAEDFYADAIGAVQDYRNAMTQWVNAQIAAFGPTRKPECTEWIKNGALHEQIKQLDDVSKAELARLRVIEDECANNKR